LRDAYVYTHMSRLEATFAALRAKEEKALIAYLMAGDPSLQETEALVLAMEEAGADVIELGVPFSDPIADGPVIQKAAERALRSGTSLRRILGTVKALRQKTHVPLVLMTYYNTIHALGEGTFCREASEVGVDGLIIPDMPPEEATELQRAADLHGIHLIYLLAPTSTPLRQNLVGRRCRGFVYYVSLTGTTGAKLTNISVATSPISDESRTCQWPSGLASPHRRMLPRSLKSQMASSSAALS
jgi:tryptophan synthase alpha chain